MGIVCLADDSLKIPRLILSEKKNKKKKTNKTKQKKTKTFRMSSLSILLYVLTLVLLNKDATPTSNFQPIRLLDPDCCYKFTKLMTNSADPDQSASSVAD